MAFVGDRRACVVPNYGAESHWNDRASQLSVSLANSHVRDVVGVACRFVTTMSEWKKTSVRCRNGEPVEEREVTTYFANGEPLIEVETRCCPACKANE